VYFIPFVDKQGWAPECAIYPCRNGLVARTQLGKSVFQYEVKIGSGQGVWYPKVVVLGVGAALSQKQAGQEDRDSHKDGFLPLEMPFVLKTCWLTWVILKRCKCAIDLWLGLSGVLIGSILVLLLLSFKCRSMPRAGAFSAGAYGKFEIQTLLYLNQDLSGIWATTCCPNIEGA
jgi:hypothetical protein